MSTFEVLNSFFTVLCIVGLDIVPQITLYHEFEPWSRKIPHASGQLSLSAETTESVHPKALKCSATREAPAMRCPCNATSEYPPVAATRESLLEAIKTQCSQIWASQEALVVKNPPENAGDVRDMSSIPELGRSSGEEHGSPLQYSCLENPMDRGAWWAP